MRMSRIMFISLALFANGCSVYQAAVQPGPVDLSEIVIGTPRQLIISKLGAPKIVDVDANGHKQDYFEYRSGMNEASKARVVPYALADVFTFGLAELALWPLEEVAMKAATCTAVATYDANLKLTSWHLHKKEKGNLPC